jgi:hypothetical protein
MSNETNHIFGNDLQQRFEIVPIYYAPQPVLRTSMTGHLREMADWAGNYVAKEIAVLLGLADAYERAAQALRDVRHLLPPDGVAIVDAALNRPT